MKVECNQSHCHFETGKVKEKSIVNLVCRLRLRLTLSPTIMTTLWETPRSQGSKSACSVSRQKRIGKIRRKEAVPTECNSPKQD